MVQLDPIELTILIRMATGFAAVYLAVTLPLVFAVVGLEIARAIKERGHDN